jgi:hypothetical protein
MRVVMTGCGGASEFVLLTSLCDDSPELPLLISLCDELTVVASWSVVTLGVGGRLAFVDPGMKTFPVLVGTKYKSSSMNGWKDLDAAGNGLAASRKLRSWSLFMFAALRGIAVELARGRNAGGALGITVVASDAGEDSTVPSRVGNVNVCSRGIEDGNVLDTNFRTLFF